MYLIYIYVCVLSGYKYLHGIVGKRKIQLPAFVHPYHMYGSTNACNARLEHFNVNSWFIKFVSYSYYFLCRIILLCV